MKKVEEPKVETTKEKPVPAFLREDYPHKAIGGELKVEDVVDGVVYEIKCHACEMSIRSQGQNIRNTWERLQSSGCIGCGNKDLKIYRVDMSAARPPRAAASEG